MRTLARLWHAEQGTAFHARRRVEAEETEATRAQRYEYSTSSERRGQVRLQELRKRAEVFVDLPITALKLSI